MNVAQRLCNSGIALAAFVLATAAWFALLATLGLPQFAPLALAGGLAAALLAGGERRLETAGFVLLATALSAWLSQLRFDVWWDGMAYHQDAIVHLARDFSIFHGRLDGQYTQLTSHYPKLSWLWGAALYSVGGDVQYAKSLNFVMMAAVLAVAPAVLSGVRPWLRIAATLALALNPIVVSQLFTTMVDGAMAHFLTLLALGLHAFARRTLPRRRALALVALAAVGAASLKFTGLVFALTALVFMAGLELLPLPARAEWTARLRARQHDCVLLLRRPMSLLLLTLTVLLLFNPYATNLLAGKHLLHPALGAEQADLMANQSTPEFRALDPASRLLLSVFARSSNLGPWSEQKLPDTKIPFMVYPDEIRTFTAVETRAAGWGPLFGGILLCALVLVLSRFDQLREFAPVLAFLALIAVLNPEAWWARFNPQLVTLVIFALLAVATVGVATRALAGALTLLLLLNSVIVFRPMFAYVTETNGWIDQDLRAFAAQVPGAQVYFQMNNFHVELMLDRLGIAHRPRAEYQGPEEALYCFDLEVYPGFPENLCLVNPRLEGAR